MASQTAGELQAAEAALFRRVSRRIIPVMIMLYFIAFLDRVNVSFAALTMNADLGFSPEVFGFGVGIFFFGYCLFEVPSNLFVERFGARIWICRIMLTWGLLSVGMAFISTQTHFYVMRFLLGVAEAGFAPAMLLYLTFWFPAAYRAKFFGIYLIAIPLASVIGAPLSSYLLTFHGAFGLAGWQWLFIIEGLPACLLGVAVLWLLPDRPASARWLSEADRTMIADALARDRLATGGTTHHQFWPMLKDRRVLLMCVIYFFIAMGLYGIGLWLPQIVKAMGFSNHETGFIVALPFLLAAILMPLWGRSSDRRQDRIWHVAIPCFVAAAGCILAAWSGASTVGLLGLGLAAIGIYVTIAPFWSLPPVFLSGTAAAGGIALINSVGNLGGFAGPYIMGFVRQHSAGYGGGLLVLAASLLAGMALMLLLGRWISEGTKAPSRR